MSNSLMPQLEEYVLRHVAKAKGVIVSGLSFMITLTLKPKLYKYNTVTQHDMSVNVVKALFARHTSGFILATEITLAGNVHYHAFAMCSDKFRRISLINQIRKNHTLGFFKISNEVEDMSNVYACIHYMIKDVALTQRVLHTPHYKPEIIYCDTTGFQYD